MEKNKKEHKFKAVVAKNVRYIYILFTKYLYF